MTQNQIKINANNQFIFRLLPIYSGEHYSDQRDIIIYFYYSNRYGCPIIGVLLVIVNKLQWQNSFYFFSLINKNIFFLKKCNNLQKGVFYTPRGQYYNYFFLTYNTLRFF